MYKHMCDVLLILHRGTDGCKKKKSSELVHHSIAITNGFANCLGHTLPRDMILKCLLINNYLKQC